MPRGKIAPFIGLGLLLVCFALAAMRVASRNATEQDPNLTIIRFAHWQLEGGIREALDRLSRDYEALNPGVIVRQVAVPERIYPQWVRTQLIGGTATDLIELGKGIEDAEIARFFTPLSKELDQPNPYNQGTALADVAWRETFLDGLQGGYNYRPNLLNYYGAPISMHTVRVFYNRPLWRRLLGARPEPTSFDDFIQLCEEVQRLGAESEHPLLPIVGSRDNGPMLTTRFFVSQTQRLRQELATMRDLRSTNTDLALGFLRGDWGLDTPAFHAGWEITRELGRFMQTGYTQASREDASFYFLQGRALMIATGSWDSSSFRAQSTFELGVFNVPIPERSHPRYGANVLGPGAESEVSTGFSFGISRQSRNHAQALDFLRFITSARSNERFSAISGWLPSVVGAEPPEHMRPFLPVTEGYVDGFPPGLSLGADSNGVLQRNMNYLLNPQGSVEDFKNRLRQSLPQAMRQDIERSLRNTRFNLNRQDVVFAALEALHESDRSKISELLEAQNELEAQSAWTTHELQRLRAR